MVVGPLAVVLGVYCLHQTGIAIRDGTLSDSLEVDVYRMIFIALIVVGAGCALLGAVQLSVFP
jgi:hypothetical protein